MAKQGKTFVATVSYQVEVEAKDAKDEAEAQAYVRRHVELPVNPALNYVQMSLKVTATKK